MSHRTNENAKGVTIGLRNVSFIQNNKKMNISGTVTLSKSHTLPKKKQKESLQARKPGLTLHGYLDKILARSCQDLGKILAKILPRYCQELQDVMVRFYQEYHVPKKTFIVKSFFAREKSERESTKINISANLYC